MNSVGPDLEQCGGRTWNSGAARLGVRRPGAGTVVRAGGGGPPREARRSGGWPRRRAPGPRRLARSVRWRWSEVPAEARLARRGDVVHGAAAEATDAPLAWREAGDGSPSRIWRAAKWSTARRGRSATDRRRRGRGRVTRAAARSPGGVDLVRSEESGRAAVKGSRVRSAALADLMDPSGSG